MGLLPRHEPPALGRSAPLDDGRSRLRATRHRLAEEGHGQLHLLAWVEHATHAHRTPRRALFYRTRTYVQDREALRVGSRPEVWQSALGALPGLRLGGRSPAREDRSRLVSEGIRQ